MEHGRRALAAAARISISIRTSGSHSRASPERTARPPHRISIDSILRESGWVTGLIGTIEYRLAGEVLHAANTTPESLDVIRMASELEKLGGNKRAALTMEVSSHALALGRVYGIRFHTAVFTNLTRDHLDFHHTMEEYAAAKRLLFYPEGFACAGVERPECGRSGERGDGRGCLAGSCGTDFQNARRSRPENIAQISTDCASIWCMKDRGRRSSLRWPGGSTC